MTLMREDGANECTYVFFAETAPDEKNEDRLDNENMAIMEPINLSRLGYQSMTKRFVVKELAMIYGTKQASVVENIRELIRREQQLYAADLQARKL